MPGLTAMPLEAGVAGFLGVPVEPTRAPGRGSLLTAPQTMLSLALEWHGSDYPSAQPSAIPPYTMIS